MKQITKEEAYQWCVKWRNKNYSPTSNASDIVIDFGIEFGVIKPNILKWKWACRTESGKLIITNVNYESEEDLRFRAAALIPIQRIDSEWIEE